MIKNCHRDFMLGKESSEHASGAGHLSETVVIQNIKLINNTVLQDRRATVKLKQNV